MMCKVLTEDDLNLLEMGRGSSVSLDDSEIASVARNLVSSEIGYIFGTARGEKYVTNSKGIGILEALR